jgi:hypothetical protein
MQVLVLVLIGQAILAFVVVAVLRAMLEKELIESAVRSFESYKKDRASPFYIPDPTRDDSQEDVSLKVVSYKNLNARYQQRIRQAAENFFGRSINPTYLVDKKILGGVVFHIGNKVIEYSLRDRLQRMKGP